VEDAAVARDLDPVDGVALGRLQVAAEHEPDAAKAAHLDVADADEVEACAGHGDVGVERDAVGPVTGLATRTDDDQPAQAHPAGGADQLLAPGEPVGQNVIV